MRDGHPSQVTKRITLTGGLAERLASRHNEVAPRPGLLTNQQWCPGAGRMRSDWIVDAITEPTVCSKRTGPSGPAIIEGRGTTRHQEFVDHAIWARPRQQVSETGAMGIVQPVRCYVETDDGKRLPQRRGWNATLPARHTSSDGTPSASAIVPIRTRLSTLASHSGRAWRETIGIASCGCCGTRPF
jgi:hypothetical protein